MAGNFLIKRLKEKFGDDEDDDSNGFDDMNYLIGNSSAMDVGEFPTPMDERIGYASMTGGSVMELQITNPATFSLERDAMISTIDQLGLDITLHPDMNAGFASAQKTGQGDQYGYETVEKYFTNYLQELAQFKYHVKENTNAKFKIGRMNPHISTSPMPSLEERMETDVGLDPFGFEINNFDEKSRKKRNHTSQNMYKNKKFLKKLYHTLFLETANYPFQNYQEFASYSNKFDKYWSRSRHLAAIKVFEDEAANSRRDKVNTLLVARGQDQGIGTAWLEQVDKEKIDTGIPIVQLIPTVKETDGGNEEADYEIVKAGEFNDLRMILDMLGSSSLQALDQTFYSIRNLEDKIQENIQLGGRGRFIRGLDNLDESVKQDAEMEAKSIVLGADFDEVSENIKDSIINAIDTLWKGTDEDGRWYISQEAKWAALQNHLEIQNIRLFENAYEIGKNELDENIEELAEKVFSGENPEDLFDPSDREEKISSPEQMHEDLLQRLLSGQQFQREMWKESTIFYQFLPAWMSCSEVSNDHHSGWDAPKFIWETLVVEKWEEKFENHDNLDINLDLRDPRNGFYGEDSDESYHYFDLLENFDEFQRDVAAAAGCCYVWAHFTQRKVKFNLRNRDYGLDVDDVEEVQNEGWTWIKWMNHFGLGVNLETMQGSPQTRFKIWRPKDIAVAAHAVNLTTRSVLDNLNDEIDGRPVKFTIDMEHVASLGAPPLDEMKRFVKQERRLAKDSDKVDLNVDKPISTILRQMHLMDPGVEGQRGTHHGAFERGNKLLYEWLYYFVENGFTRNENEPATVLFELAEHNDESSYMMRLTMNLIEIGVGPDELDPSNVSPGEKPEDEREALIARFFGMEQVNYNREWAKIEQHAFDPLKGLLEAEDFDYTFSSKAAIENDVRPGEFSGEEYR